MKTILLAGVAAAGLTFGVAGVHAATITAFIVDNPTLDNVPFTLENLGSGGAPGAVDLNNSFVTSTGAVVSYTGLSGIYSGDVDGITRSPIRDAAGDATDLHYLNARANDGFVQIDMPINATAFNMLWGSVDGAPPADWNLLTFTFMGAGNVVFTVTGDDIIAAAGGAPPVVPGTSNIAEAGGFVKSDPGRDRPNVQFHFIPAYLRDHGRQISFGYGYTLHVCDLLPESRGRIGLASPDPTAKALIEPNYLRDHRDIDTMLKALKIGRAIMDAPALAAHRKVELLPGPQVQSDEALVDDIRARAETIYHPAGTCRMGADAASVVDPQLRVRGVEGLRVVDASVMPRLIAGNTNAPTMMIAENAAEMMTGGL